MITVPHLHCTGNLTVSPTITPGIGVLLDDHVAANAAIARTKHEVFYGLYNYDFTRLRIHDAGHNPLPAVSAADDLTVAEGAFGTGTFRLTTEDVTNSSITRYAAGQIELPMEYVSSGEVSFNITAGMTQAVAQVSATVDLEVYEADKEGGIGSDLCTTAATDFNSETFATKAFVITDSGLVAGDQLHFRIAWIIDDTGGSNCTGTIARIQMQCQIQG